MSRWPAFVVPLLAVAVVCAVERSPVSKDTLPATLAIDEIPLGLGARPEPKDNPLSAVRVTLGRQLFFDPILSTGLTVASASCHRPEHGARAPAERHGLWLYESKAQCWRCHGGPNFTDEKFHNTGVTWGGPDLGRQAVTRADPDRGKFKTPTLRGAALTAPYMHDGSL